MMTLISAILYHNYAKLVFHVSSISCNHASRASGQSAHRSPPNSSIVARNCLVQASWSGCMQILTSVIFTT